MEEGVGTSVVAAAVDPTAALADNADDKVRAVVAVPLPDGTATVLRSAAESWLVSVLSALSAHGKINSFDK